MTKSILSYLFSLIGFVPIQELQTLQLQQQRKRLTDKEEECQYLTSSTFVIEEKKKEDWLYNIPKITTSLCQIIEDDGIYNNHNRYYYHDYHKNSNHVKELKWIQSEANKIVHLLDNLRPSEQFGRSYEVGNLLHELLSIIQRKSYYNSSFMSLFGLIILSQEALNCPSEVKQYIFTDIKFGRSIILEISKVLKNFKNQQFSDIKQQWMSLGNSLSWFDSLQFICTKLSRYDITWEYRKEYQDVVLISEKYYK